MPARSEPAWPYDEGLVAQARLRLDSVLQNLDEIHDVTELGIRTLMLGHRWGGTTFHDSGWNPRHIEGMEHFFYYNLERLTGKHYIHGQPVGLGIVIGSALQENGPDRMLGALRRAGVDVRPEAMGDTWDDAAEAMRTLAAVRPQRRPLVHHRGRQAHHRGVHRGRAAHGGGGVRPMDQRERRAMKIGLTLPQGCDREYLGLEPAHAWRRTIEIAQRAEQLGFESLWVNDHFQVDPPLIEAPIFEPFVELAGLAMVTKRARLGHLVLAAAYRNAGLTAKAISTLDVLSGGRTELGIGAGWKEDEWLAYGYGFPDTRTRLAILADYLEIITRMLGPGRATWAGEHAHVVDAIHEPKGLQQPRIPIVIGGNGPKVTWRLGGALRGRDQSRCPAAGRR